MIDKANIPVEKPNNTCHQSRLMITLSKSYYPNVGTLLRHNVTLAALSRNALESTKTLESPMAAAPSIGEKVTPDSG